MKLQPPDTPRAFVIISSLNSSRKEMIFTWDTNARDCPNKSGSVNLS